MHRILVIISALILHSGCSRIADPDAVFVTSAEGGAVTLIESHFASKKWATEEDAFSAATHTFPKMVEALDGQLSTRFRVHDVHSVCFEYVPLAKSWVVIIRYETSGRATLDACAVTPSGEVVFPKNQR